MQYTTGAVALTAIWNSLSYVLPDSVRILSNARRPGKPPLYFRSLFVQLHWPAQGHDGLLSQAGTNVRPLLYVSSCTIVSYRVARWKFRASVAIFLMNTLLVTSPWTTFLYQLFQRASGIGRVSRSLLHLTNSQPQWWRIANPHVCVYMKEHLWLKDAFDIQMLMELVATRLSTCRQGRYRTKSDSRFIYNDQVRAHAALPRRNYL